MLPNIRPKNANMKKAESVMNIDDEDMDEDLKIQKKE